MLKSLAAIAVIFLLSTPAATAAPASTSNAVLGPFGELALPTSDLPESIRYWTDLGFRKVLEHSTPEPFAILTDGAVTIGLHQTQGFAEAALTYFSPDMGKRIEKLIAAGKRFEALARDAQGNLTGAALRSPEGQLIYLFAGDASSPANRGSR